jgi:WD40 repeat protein
MVIVFSSRKFEIATSVKNNIRIWCALTGNLLTCHNKVIDGNITAMSLGLGERRCFVGSDTGHLAVINFACGAFLKELTKHECEVTEIQCIPTKVLTLSVGDKLIVVHDDTNPQKANILKTIDLSGAGTVLRMSHDNEKILAGGGEDGEVFWFSMEFAKQVSNTTRCPVTHTAPVSCVKYLRQYPLMCTADAEASVIFWSMQPLRSFEFFTKLEPDLTKRKDGASQSSPASTTSQHSAVGSVGITSLAISWPEEESLIVGSEQGNIVCISIKSIVETAESQRKEILERKEKGEAADVISGRIFDFMEKPRNSPEYVYTPENMWLVERAHRGSIDQIVFCKLDPPVLITLGFDQRVCIWSPETGESFGTLEQGLSEGLSYERRTKWRFPINAYAQVEKDLKELEDAQKVSEAGSEEEEKSKEASEDGKGTKEEPAKKSPPGSEKGSQKPSMLRSGSAPSMVKKTPYKLNGIEYPDYTKTASRLLAPKQAYAPDWFVGRLASTEKHGGSLPGLSSGLRRSPNQKQEKAVVEAAKKLSRVLSSIDSKRSFDQKW